MKRKNNWEMPVGRLTRVRDFLPPPSRLVVKSEKEPIRTERWSSGPGAVYSVHDHPYRKVLVVERGSIEFRLSGPDRVVRLNSGDRLELPARTPHSAVVGPAGVACVERHFQ